MDEKNQIVYNYLDRIFRNGNKQADVKIAQQDPKRCKVSVIKENDELNNMGNWMIHMLIYKRSKK